MHTRISPCRSQLSDRFPVASFIVKVPPTRFFEVACATDPRLFLPQNTGHRTRDNFYTSRAAGLMRAPAGEANYLLPPAQLKRFSGNQRIYFAVATFDNPRGDDARTSVDPEAFEKAPYVLLAPDFTGRSLDRSRLGATYSDSSATYGSGGAPLLWGGDLALGQAQTDTGYDDGYDNSLWGSADDDDDGLPDYAQGPEDEDTDGPRSQGWGTESYADDLDEPYGQLEPETYEDDDGQPYGSAASWSGAGFDDEGEEPYDAGQGHHPDPYADDLGDHSEGVEEPYEDDPGHYAVASEATEDFDKLLTGADDGYGGPYDPGFEDGSSMGGHPHTSAGGGVEDASALGGAPVDDGYGSGWDDPLDDIGYGDESVPYAQDQGLGDGYGQDPYDDDFAYGDDLEEVAPTTGPFGGAPADIDEDRGFELEDDEPTDDPQGHALSDREELSEPPADGWSTDPSYGNALQDEVAGAGARETLPLDPLGKAGLLYAVAEANGREHPFAATRFEPESGLRYGVAGFDQASGSLGGLLARFQDDAPQAFESAFGDHGQELLQVTTAPSPGDRMAEVAGRPLSDPMWEERFTVAGSERALQKAQLKEAVARWVDPNLGFARRLGLTTDGPLAALVGCCEAYGNHRGRGLVADALCPITSTEIADGDTERLGSVLRHLGFGEGGLTDQLDAFQTAWDLSENREFGPETQGALIEALRGTPHPDFPTIDQPDRQVQAIAAHPDAPTAISALTDSAYLTGQPYELEW